LTIYFDSSALIKRAIEEPESDALIEMVAAASGRGETLVTSALTTVEVGRVVRARRESSDPRSWAYLAAGALSAIDEVAIDGYVISLAKRVAGPALRSMDAIHLATALLLDAEEFVTYDQRLASVAEEMGLQALSPV